MRVTFKINIIKMTNIYIIYLVFYSFVCNFILFRFVRGFFYNKAKINIPEMILLYFFVNINSHHKKLALNTIKETLPYNLIF